MLELLSFASLLTTVSANTVRFDPLVDVSFKEVTEWCLKSDV